MHYQTVTPFEQWMRDNVYGKMAPSSEIKELLAMAFEGGQKHTHPAQPLSDDAVNAILVKHGLDNVELAGNHIDVVLLMRDVEHAHGIGERDDS
jgi:hypothetical protein